MWLIPRRWPHQPEPNPQIKHNNLLSEFLNTFSKNQPCVDFFDGQLFGKDKNPSTLVARLIPRRWPHQPEPNPQIKHNNLLSEFMNTFSKNQPCVDFFDGQLFRKDKNPSTLVVRSIPRRWPHQPDDRFAGNARNNYRCVG